MPAPVNFSQPVRPTAFPAPVPLVDTPRYGGNLREKTWLDREVAVVEYRKGDERMTVSARIGDWNHVGNRVVGTFAEAVGKARVEAAIDEIDMPELGAAAVLRGHGRNEWIVVPLMGYGPGQHYGDEDVELNLPIDPEHGTMFGPERVWEQTGASRSSRRLPDAIDDATHGALRVTAQRTHPDLVAIVGVDRWMNFGSEHYERLLGAKAERA